MWLSEVHKTAIIAVGTHDEGGNHGRVVGRVLSEEPAALQPQQNEQTRVSSERNSGSKTGPVQRRVTTKCSATTGKDRPCILAKFTVGASRVAAKCSYSTALQVMKLGLTREYMTYDTTSTGTQAPASHSPVSCWCWEFRWMGRREEAPGRDTPGAPTPCSLYTKQ